MQGADDELAEVLAAPERTPSHTTRLGGRELGPQVRSWTVERAYNTDLPEAMRAFSGSAAAQMDVQLSGADGAPAPRLYSAWAPRLTGDVVRPGQSVVHRTGAGGRTLPAFRGTVRSRSAASGSDTVSVQALDGAERLRGKATLPRPYHGYLYGQPVATATWCVDELLRQGGIHTCPPPRAPDFDPEDAKPFTVLHASLHGGFNAACGQPETLPAASTYDWVREGAPFEMALMPRAAGLKASWMPRSRFTVPGRVFQVECWVNTAVARGSKVELAAIFDRSQTRGRIAAVYDTATGIITITSGILDGTGTSVTWKADKLAALKGRWHLGFMVDTSRTATGSGGALVVEPTVQPRLTGPDGSYWVGGVYTFAASGAGAQHPGEFYRLDLTTDMATEALQVTDRVWPDTASYPRREWEQAGTWTKGAVLDDAVLPLISVPVVTGSQWEAITEIARAALCTAEFDERGVFRWRNPSRFATVPAQADLTVTTRRDIASLTVTEEIDACRNHCEQPYQDWTGVGYAAGTVVTDPAIRRIDPGKYIEVTYGVAEDESDIGPPIVEDAMAGQTGNRVRFGSAATGGTSVRGSVAVSCRREGPSFILRFSNRGTAPVWTVTEDGRPSVRVVSAKNSADPKERAWARWSPASQSYYGKQQYTAPTTGWVQDRVSAYTLAQTLLDAGRYPVPLLGDVEVLPDPRIQLGDVVRVVDAAGARLDTLAWVVGMRTSWTAGGAPRQTLTLRGTSFNGVPSDSGLTPDPPLDPQFGRSRLYGEVRARYATLADLKAAVPDYRRLREIPEGEQ